MAEENVDPSLQEALGETERLIIQQKIEYLEAAANAAANAIGMDELGAFGEQANEYKIYADDGGNGNEKFKVIEVSEYCGLTGRCCCRPNHALKLLVSPPNDPETEIMYMDRPCKCGQCCACTDICQQEMYVYQGDLKADKEPNPNHLIGYIKQPILGGMLSPTLDIMDREGSEPFATIQAEATCFIGGMCCDHTFTVKDATTGEYMGKIVKERPEGLSNVVKELGTDADNFTLYVNKNMNVKRKANMLAALHLIDYWLFEDEGDFKLDVVNQECSIKCCDCYCFGCVIPCKCNCGGGGSGGDRGDGGDE